MASPAIFAPPQTPMVQPPPSIGACWRDFSPEIIVHCTQGVQWKIEANWPAVYAELEKRLIASPEIQAGAIGTMAIETARTFEPVREAYWLSEEWRANNLRYYPYYGRGYIQLTWDYNYTNYGSIIGQPLYNQPDLALEPDIAAAVFAEFFGQSGAAAAAARCDWAECRRRVQGADAGLSELIAICTCLGYP